MYMRKALLSRYWAALGSSFVTNGPPSAASHYDLRFCQEGSIRGILVSRYTTQGHAKVRLRGH